MSDSFGQQQEWDSLRAELETSNLCIKGLEGNLAQLEKELATAEELVKELEGFIEGLADDHYARLSVLEWLRERKHDTTRS